MGDAFTEKNDDAFVKEVTVRLQKNDDAFIKIVYGAFIQKMTMSLQENYGAFIQKWRKKDCGAFTEKEMTMRLSND